MNEDDVKEFLTICLMCGDGVPARNDLENPDLVAEYMCDPLRPRGMFNHCMDRGLLTQQVRNPSGKDVYYVSQAGKDLLL